VAPAWVVRNTILIVARAFPVRWLPQVLYRQAAWARHDPRAWLAGVRMAAPLLLAMARERRALRTASRVPIGTVVPARPIRGPRAGGHPSRYAPR
jgi:hypothetical protein